MNVVAWDKIVQGYIIFYIDGVSLEGNNLIVKRNEV